jgi:tetratricopeptide (TPR) repeat protein
LSWVCTGPVRFDEADGIYRQATNALPDGIEACFGYAVFSQYLNRHQRALPAYERALALARLSGEEGKVAMVLNNLGNLYRDQNRVEEALEAYEEALEIHRKLAEANPETYLPDMAETLYSLGVLHLAQNEMEDALRAFTEALNIYQTFANQNPERYEREVERVQRLLHALKQEPALAQ